MKIALQAVVRAAQRKEHRGMSPSAPSDDNLRIDTWPTPHWLNPPSEPMAKSKKTKAPKQERTHVLNIESANDPAYRRVVNDGPDTTARTLCGPSVARQILVGEHVTKCALRYLGHVENTTLINRELPSESFVLEHDDQPVETP